MHLWATDGWIIMRKIFGGNVGQDMVRWASQVAVRYAFIVIFFCQFKVFYLHCMPRVLGCAGELQDC
jgi:hypothetical protein